MKKLNKWNNTLGITGVVEFYFASILRPVHILLYSRTLTYWNYSDNFSRWHREKMFSTHGKNTKTGFCWSFVPLPLEFFFFVTWRRYLFLLSFWSGEKVLYKIPAELVCLLLYTLDSYPCWMWEPSVAQQSNICPKGDSGRDSGEAFPQGSILYHGEPTNEDLSRVGVS